MQEKYGGERGSLWEGIGMNKQKFYEHYSMEELLPLVAELSRKYTSNESSSITYERANQLMEAVIYSIRELEGEEGENMLQGALITAKEAYGRGYQRLIDKVVCVKDRYNAMIVQFEAYGNRTYYETVVAGLSRFFLYYDPIFMPQNHILTLDYPVLTPCNTHCGIDVIEQYIDSICVEQLFLNRLPKEYVVEVLEAYHPEYKEIVLNISAIVMRNLVGDILADKPISRKGFLKEEYDTIKREIKAQMPVQIEKKLDHAVMIILEKGYPREKKELHTYFSKDIGSFAYELMNASEHDVLERIFVI